LSILGRHDESIDIIKKIKQLDPDSYLAYIYSGIVYSMARHYDESISEWQRAIVLNPVSFLPHYYLVFPYIQTAKYGEAISEAHKLIEITGGEPLDTKAILALAYAAAGKKEKAQEYLNEVFRLSKKSYVPSSSIARIYLCLEQKDEVFHWLEKAYEERDAWLFNHKVFPIYDPVRSDPRFKTLLKKMKLDE
jgi:tetratricopeptide (TPR) repeat protein